MCRDRHAVPTLLLDRLGGLRHFRPDRACLGCYVFKTPNIDSIAARGTRFERFYVATPVCMPNRATLMAGRMPSVHGVRSNGSPLSLESNTFIDALCIAGCAPRSSARAIYRIFPIFRQSSSGRRRSRAIRCSTRNLRGPSVAPDACGTMSGPFASPFEPHTLCGWCASPRR